MSVLDGSLSRRAALAAGLAASAAACAPAVAQAAHRSYALPDTAVLPFQSKINGVAYELYVRAPQPAAGAPTPPLIFTLDADYQFAIAVNHVEHLSGRMNQAPPAVVASLAYANQYPDRAQYQRDRTRDYTPVFWPEGGYGPEFQKASGGGPDFLRVIVEEALPRLAAYTNLSESDRTIVGHSYGGLFAAWLLCAHPDVFSRYLVVSPSLWYADGMLLRLVKESRQATLPRPTRVYMGVGSWEEQPQNRMTMVSDLQQFSDALAKRGDPNLWQKLRVFEDETHASIFPACFSTGIRHLFAA